MSNTNSNAHCGRNPSEVTTEDLIVDATRRRDSATRESARAELTRRGIRWEEYI